MSAIAPFTTIEVCVVGVRAGARGLPLIGLSPPLGDFGAVAQAPDPLGHVDDQESDHDSQRK
jgi:hypothetical protein